MALTYRSITDDELAHYRSVYTIGFGSDAPPDDEDGLERLRAILPVDRTVAAFDGDAMVGTLGDFPLLMTLPGGHQEPIAGTTEVTVQPTHRRQGILREMMRRHLAMVADRGESMAALWASEPGIYGRFGFGLATEKHDVSIDTRLVELPAAPADIAMVSVEPEQLLDVVAPYWSAVARQPDRAGFIDRVDERWHDLMADPADRRQGASKPRSIVAKRGDEIVGYVSYRQKSGWDGMPQGTVLVLAMVASDIGAHRALWHFVTHVDLCPNVSYWSGAIDDPIAHEASNSRVVKRRVDDALYVRVLDPVQALSARTYETDGAVVIGIADGHGHAAGTYALTVENGTGSATRVDAPADAAMDVRELGALILGRDCAAMLASMGLITGDDAAIRDLARLLRTTRAPHCVEEF